MWCWLVCWGLQGVLSIIRILLSAGADKRIVWEFELQQVRQFHTEKHPILQTSGFFFPHEVRLALQLPCYDAPILTLSSNDSLVSTVCYLDCGNERSSKRREAARRLPVLRVSRLCQAQIRIVTLNER